MIWFILWDINFPQHLLNSLWTLAIFSGLTKGPLIKIAASPPPRVVIWCENQMLSNALWAHCLVFVSNLAFCTISPILAFLGWPHRLFEKYSETGSLQRLVFTLFDGFSGCSVSLCFCHRKHVVHWVVPNPGSVCKSFKMIHLKFTALKS